MTTAPYWHDASSALYVGDARDVLATMSARSADCIVTSPPYWAKRDYGVRDTATSPTQPDTSRRCASCSARPGASWPMTGRAG